MFLHELIIVLLLNLYIYSQRQGGAPLHSLDMTSRGGGEEDNVDGL